MPVVDILLEPSFDLPLYSLGAFAIGIPPGDDLPGRGFTVALYETRKYHKDRLIDDRLDATSAKGVVRADKAKDAIELSKGHEYTLILFGDQLPSTPSPYSPAQYPGAPGFGQPAQLPGTPGTVPQADTAARAALRRCLASPAIRRRRRIRLRRRIPNRPTTEPYGASRRAFIVSSS